jgi:hypothetical protein
MVSIVFGPARYASRDRRLYGVPWIGRRNTNVASSSATATGAAKPTKSCRVPNQHVEPPLLMTAERRYRRQPSHGSATYDPHSSRYTSAGRMAAQETLAHQHLPTNKPIGLVTASK